MAHYSRRRFLRSAAHTGVYLQSGWLLACSRGNSSSTGGEPETGVPPGPEPAACTTGMRSNIAQLGPLGEPDEFGVRVPPGFTVRRVAAEGVPPIAGQDFIWHEKPDGGACFAAPDGGWVYVSNSEKNDINNAAGVGALRFNADGELVDAYPILVGSTKNCAGGATPWGTWLSCEESLQSADTRHTRDHGWVFEVPSSHRGLVDARPLAALGRFNHEAAAVDPATGIVYLTEDRPDGLFYRFVPHERGRLAAGGRLQALAIAERASADTRGWQAQTAICEPGCALRVRWIDLDGVDAPGDDLRLRGHAGGAALFARGEGLWWGSDACWFACTSGGAAQAGQIFRFRPDARGGSLTLFVESTDPARFANADNLTVAPWGDLIVCEDTNRACRLLGVRPDGSLYALARNPYNDSELAGACFAPDGRTLFVNVQWAGLTLAIRGPFESL